MSTYTGLLGRISRACFHEGLKILEGIDSSLGNREPGIASLAQLQTFNFLKKEAILCQVCYLDLIPRSAQTLLCPGRKQDVTFKLKNSIRILDHIGKSSFSTLEIPISLNIYAKSVGWKPDCPSSRLGLIT